MYFWTQLYTHPHTLLRTSPSCWDLNQQAEVLSRRRSKHRISVWSAAISPLVSFSFHNNSKHQESAHLDASFQKLQTRLGGFVLLRNSLFVAAAESTNSSLPQQESYSDLNTGTHCDCQRRGDVRGCPYWHGLYRFISVTQISHSVQSEDGDRRDWTERPLGTDSTVTRNSESFWGYFSAIIQTKV